NEAFVHQGVAVLAKNEASQTSGFHLGTKALNLGDSGETIGVVADGSSSAEAVVFDGGAKVCLPKLGFCRDLFALEPVKADLNREKLFDIPYNPNVFARAWQANAGIERNTGAMKVAMPGESAKAGEGERGVRLSVEKLRFTANEDIEVDTLEPGQFKEVAAGGGSKMAPAGRQFRSYLLQWDSEKGILTKDGEPVEASVTFDHEIVGVIYSPERLAESDELVGVSAAAVTERVSKMIANGNVEGDQILLSDDRRTVNLKLNGRGGAERL
ncbi:MAG: hypothetical protein KDM63_21865, partial [Verrucomicrobiae bacterium]|nr:hypothetical protein [Verrucomicrobiae bacterium]